jgi:glycosyltransferase involved in cell wall biosynthesis
LVPPGAASALAAALERLWADPGLGRRLAAEGAARARRDHDVAANTDRLLALIAAGTARPAEVVR